jgi:adenosylmethionine-8-amino-7-oxononanoate aminotransferase
VSLDRDAVIALDKRHVWHPYTPMDEWIDRATPIVVARARGAWLEDADGRRYLDGNSSWWVAGLGHGHPRLLRALAAQAEAFAHCALAGIAHEPAARLAAELCAIAPRGGQRDPSLSRVFYTDNGSTAIEVAVKMCVQAWRQMGGRGENKTRFVALDGAFHGDTIGAASLGGVEVFRRPFAGVLFDCAHAPFPEPDAYARAFEAIARIVREGADTIAGVVVEPIVQGAAGMRVYPAEYLRELRALCDRHDVFLVADEVFAGYGRTGPMWACDHAQVVPDVMCIGKVFSSILPMGAALTTERIFDVFRGGKERALYYGHTFCGHPLGAAVAREVLAIYRDEDVLGQVARKSVAIRRAFDRIASIPGIARARSIGMVGAADIASSDGYLGGVGWRVYEEARRRGAYLRPMGDTVYVCPPLTIDDADLESLLGILEESVRAVLGSSSE